MSARRHIGLVFMLALGFLTNTVGAAEGVNLVANGDFSQMTNGQPANWQATGDAKLVTQALRILKEADGTGFAQLACTRFERQTGSAHAMLAQVGQVKLVKGRVYEFSCRLRAENLAGRSVSVAISDTKVWRNCGLEAQFPLTDAWKTHRRIFRATQDVGPSSRLQFWYTEMGTLCVADVRIVEYKEEAIQFTDVVPAGDGKNLLPNGSFELGEAGWSSIGSGAGWGNLDRLHGTIATSQPQHGESFLRIAVGGKNTPVLYFDYLDPVVRREFSPMAASQGWIKLEKGATYTLSCSMRSSMEGTPAVLGVSAREPNGGSRQHQQNVKLTKTWQRYSMTFQPQHGYGYVFVGPNLPQEQEVEVDVDAIQLEKSAGATEYRPHRAVSFAILPGAPSGIFYTRQPAYLNLRTRNDSEAAAKVTFKFQVRDFEDQPVALPERTIEIPAHSTAQPRIELPREWRGYYHITASAEVGGTTMSDGLPIAIVPRPTANNSVCGINHAFAPRTLINLASKAGVTWYRDWSVRWQHIEPEKGNYRWELADVQIDRVLKENVSVLPMLPPFPSANWASEAPPTVPTTGYPGVRLRQAWGPKDPQELAGFIEKAVGRYKDRIHIWEFLNEPIYTDYSLPGKLQGQYGGRAYTPADYVSLLTIAAGAMRKADPTCKVIGGVGSGPKQMTQELIDAGILKQIDLFNLHIYPHLRAPEAYADEMADFQKRMDAAGGRKPIWITEFSYYGADNLPRKPFIPRDSNWSENRLLDSERQCADYTIRFFAVMLSRGVEKIFIHAGSSGKANDPSFECCLFDYGGAPRKVFPALAVMMNLLGPEPRCVGDRRFGPGGHGVAFETGKASVVMLWQTQEGRGIVFPRVRLTWLDLMGRVLPDVPAKLSSSPVYVIGPAGKAKEILNAIR